ncbi:MAG: hypothetical protein IKP56_00945 [Bacilli bacterium]|nr:hypothetical protein [Bacilli bacterium]
MSIITSVRRCYHCGKVLQDKDPQKEGYIDPSALIAVRTNQMILCQECYEELHPNTAPAVADVSDEFLSMLRDAKKEGATIVYLVDLISFECSFNKDVLDLITDLPIVIIASKWDLMPKEVEVEHTKEYVAHRFRAAGFKKAKATDVVLLNFNSSADVTLASGMIKKKHNGKNVFVIGAKGAGKSAFLNSFIRQFKNTSNRGIMIGAYKNTSLEVWQIPLDDHSYIYDTPGTGVKNSFLGKPNPPKEILVTSKIVSRKQVVALNGSLFIGGIARIDPIRLSSEKKRTSFTCYFAPKVALKSITPKNDMTALFQKYIKNKALKPCVDWFKCQNDADVFDFELEEDGPRDLGIAGVGWVSFEGKKGDIYRVYVPKNIGTYASRAKIIIKKKEGKKK